MIHDLPAETLVFVSAAIATFVGSVIAEEQSDRLTNGAYGAIAGGAVGGLAALLKNSEDLLLFGILGSAAGAAAGWITYLLFSFLAIFGWGERMVEYQVGGLKGVRERIRTKDREVLLAALASWSQHFSRLVVQDRNFIVDLDCSPDTNEVIKHTLRNWLATATDTLNLVLHALGQHEELRSRCSIILFSEHGIGAHWLSYAGGLSEHQPKPFDKNSIAYKVLRGQLPSPHFVRIENIDEKGQERSSPTSQAGSEKRYYAFMTFKLGRNAVLTVDWPAAGLQEGDSFVKEIRHLYYLYVAPSIADAMRHWHGGIISEAEALVAHAEKQEPARQPDEAAVVGGSGDPDPNLTHVRPGAEE